MQFNLFLLPNRFLGHKNDRSGGVDALPRDVDARLRDVDAHFGDVDVHPRLPNDRADDVNDQINDVEGVILRRSYRCKTRKAILKVIL